MESRFEETGEESKRHVRALVMLAAAVVLLLLILLLFGPSLWPAG